ncbi:hypothetical protein [Streptomyces sp. SID12501]|uniref:SDR family NAD(P)-dependent oxidoreductase n=1 Tax=Streptomyces sp. SID12501 TaxID=2706042 RepID=A0A6B3BGA2_9ACTN|nr:hypothetical protein [Streptomyces sp. SID12501]NEC85517.1 hypothetical protein [Streptomyces sp. SID12501]
MSRTDANSGRDGTTVRSALVTGGARGLGAATAERLRADGVRVTTLDLAPGGADIRADVTDEEAQRRVAAEIEQAPHRDDLGGVASRPSSTSTSWAP